jgi:rhamnosyltransferase subunit B
VTRIVLAASGSEGDVHPFIAVALRLKAMGLGPVVATRPAFRDRIEAAGLNFHPVRPDVADLEAMGLDADTVARETTHPVTGLRFLIKRIMLACLRQSYDDYLDATEGAALVVTHSFAFAARMAAETRSLPWRSAALQPYAFMSASDPPVLGMIPAIDSLRPILPAAAYRRIFQAMAEVSEPWFEPLHSLRATLGLPALNDHPLFGGQMSADALGLYSPLMGAVQPDFPPGARLTGFPFYDSADGAAAVLPADLEAFLEAGEAPIVFSLGTAAGLNAGDFFETSLETARRLGRRAVLLTGAGSPGPAPSNDAFACAYAPHSLLLPRASVVVHQGGIGVSGQALRAGRPQVIVPVMADQPDNAARLARLGVGRVLPRGRYSAEAAARAVERVEASPKCLSAARDAARVIAGEDGATLAAELIARALI